MNNLDSNNLEEVINLEKLEQQKQVLQNDITGDIDLDYTDRIKVYNLECGTGKTLTTLETLKTTQKKILFVGTRVSDIEMYAEILNKDNSFIRCGMEGMLYAFAWHSDLYTNKIDENKALNTLCNYRVLFITHEKYKVLSKDTTQRNKFTAKREVLIIDEFVNMCEINQISRQYKEKLSDMLHSDSLRSKYFTPLLEDTLNLIEAKGSQNRLFVFDYDKKIINSLLLNIKNSKDIIGTEQKQLVDYLTLLKVNSGCTGYISNKTFYFADNSIKYWTLDKTIMLDASSQLNPYDTDKFVMMNQSKVLNHSNWNLFQFKDNTTKSGKNKMLNFADLINEKIQGIGEDDTLYIGSKADEEVINCKYINHFGNLTGSNTYKELSNVIVGSTPQIPFHVYVIQYLYYYNKIQSDFDKTFKVVKINTKTDGISVFRFKDSRFETIRVNSIANEIYQGIKRVNRDMSRKSNVVIFQHDIKIVDKVIGLMKGINIISLDGIIEKVEVKSTKQISSVDILFEMLEKMGKNNKDLKHLLQVKKIRDKEVIQKKMYKKSLIIEELGIKKTQFKNIIGSIEVVEWLEKHKVVNSGQVLDFSKYKK